MPGNGLRQANVHRRITLFASPGLDWIAGSSSLLIGRLFDREGGRPLLSGQAVDEALNGGLERFVASHWGSYVLITEKDDELLVLRDPSGAVPCYWGGSHGAEFLASDASIACALGLLDNPSFDPHFLIHWLQFPFLRSARTGIAGIEEMAPGAVRTLSGGNSSGHQLWEPSPFARNPARDFEEAAMGLRRIAKSSVPIAAGDGPLLIQLSGGLDSSILAACLTAQGRDIKAVTFATSSPDGDEQHYARAVTDHLGIPLRVVSENDPGAEAPCGLPFRPGANLLLEEIDQAVEHYRLEAGAELVVDGGGGDSLFGFSRTAAAVIDALGTGETWNIIQSVAERSAASVWQVIWTAIRQSLRRPVGWPEDRRFLSEGAMLRRPDGHPWLEDIARLAAGKREHLLSLVHIQHFLDRHAIGGEHRHPLMNQPLIEYCLSVPSWMWSSGGRDRYVARHAFRDSLPPAIIRRRTKGSLQGYFHRRFRTLVPAIRQLLLEGELARSGLIDSMSIEAALCRMDDGLDDEVAMRLSEIATLERWMGRWAQLSDCAGDTPRRSKSQM